MTTASALVERFLVAPTADLARRVDVWLPAGDGALGRFAGTSGRVAIAGGRLPALPLLILLAAGLAILVALAAPGLPR
jgi:hypothetical protein